MGTHNARPRQAIILVGGEGRRLRPITSRVPKPVAPVFDRPFVSYILENLVRHGVEHAIFSTGFLAEAIEAEIGDGSAYGLRVDYAVEDEPLGTAGAIANCEEFLDGGSFFVFNGDVLSDVDLTAFAALHADRGATGTIFLTAVDDPRRYGLVRLQPDGAVASFIEKPGEWEGEALINAGVYVLEPEVLEMIPRGRLFSIERGVFPSLAQAGVLYGFVGRGYWRDIGTPESYLQAHFDVLNHVVETTLGERAGASYLSVAPSASVHPDARVIPPSYVGEGARVEAGARIGPLATLGAGASVGADAVVVKSVLQADVVVDAHAHVEASVVVRGTRIGVGSQIDGAVLGEGCEIGAGNQLACGIRLSPETKLADGAVQFDVHLRGEEARR